MATLSSDGSYVTVVRGDTLWGIAATHLGSGTKYKQLAAINNISNPNLIYVGQKIYLSSSSSGSSGSSSTSKKVDTNKATIDAFGLQSDSDNTLFAIWSWSKSNTDKYQVKWEYKAGGVWFVGSSSSNSVDEHDPESSKQSTYNIPDNATMVRFKVKPISKTYTSNDTETSYWTAEWSTTKTYDVSELPPKTPGTPDVTIEKYKLTAELDNLDVNATTIQFQIVKDNDSVFKTGTATIKTGHASYSCTVDAGYEYKVRCRSCRDGIYSDWSAYSDNQSTVPAASSGITICRASDETSVYLEWAAVNSAETYEIEYTTKKEYFDGSDETTAKSTESTYFTVTGLTSGQEYFFRVRAVNTEGESAWTDIKSVVIGTKPSAPTTWSVTKVIVGEPLFLYWVHNSQDGSSETFAELEMYVDGVYIPTGIIENTREEDEKDKTSFYEIDTTEYAEGTTIQWRVRTAGITKQFGDWSTQRTVDIYAPATVELHVTDADGDDIEVLESFPFYIKALPGPKTQSPISYHVSIISNEIYETTDNVGNIRMVNKGEEVYSQHYDIFTDLTLELSAFSVDLENNIEYTVKCTVSMNSGLTAEDSVNFRVSWTDVEYQPNAEIGIDEETFVAHIRPYCEDRVIRQYKVDFQSGEFIKTSEIVDQIYANRSDISVVDPDTGEVYNETAVDEFTTTGERVYSGTTIDGEDIYFCMDEESTPLDNISLAVYRREYDGRFVEIASGLNNLDNTYVTDPHPSLDYARYRVVATDMNTGAISFYDVPGYPVGGKAVIIQWDEEWSNFDVSSEDAIEQPPWSGSLLSLPYDIDVADQNSGKDVALIEYIGRSHPTTYYGTQLGQTATWNTNIPKSDKETLYALRRLAIWMGDVYVREPSGSGYWANISVSFSQKHCVLTIPVTLEVTRVEGGV